MEQLVALRPTIQTISLLGFGGIFILSIVLLYYKKPIGYVIPPLLWAIHGLAFYAFVLLRTPLTPNEYVTTWSSILRVHGEVVLTAVLLVEVYNAVVAKRGLKDDTR